MNIEITVVYHSKTCTSYNVFHTIIIIPDEHGKLKKTKTIDKGKIRRKKKEGKYKRTIKPNILVLMSLFIFNEGTAIY